jgi:predicted DNA-binding transcriptional regulator AlpA
MTRLKSTAPERPSLDKLWTPKELSDYLGLTVATMAQMRYTGTGPAFIKLGHQVRYRELDIQTWLADRTKTKTAS